MSVSDTSRRGSTASAAFAAACHTDVTTRRYISKLDEGIAHLGKVTLGGGRTGRGHESASSVANRLGSAGHIFCLLEKCFLQTSTTEEGIRLFVDEMKTCLRSSWKGHYAGREAKLEAKIDEVISTLMSNSAPYTAKLSRRAQGFKEAVSEVGSKGIIAVAGENQGRFNDSIRDLEDRVMAVIRHRSDGSSMETTRLVSTIYEGYGAAEIATGGPLAKLHKLLCKSEMRAANPREIHFILVRNLAERLNKEKGYSPEDANRKAFHIVQELFKRGKDEIGTQFDYIQGYVEAIHVGPGFVRHQREMVPTAELASLISVSPADASVLSAQHFEALSRMRKNSELDARLRTVLGGLSSGTSSSAIVDKITSDPALLREMIVTCLANAGTMGEETPERGQIIGAIEGGFVNHFIRDDSSVLKSVITAGRKPIEEKLAKVCESLTAFMGAKFSSDELLDMYRQVIAHQSGVEKDLSSTDRMALERLSLDRGVIRAQEYENSWAKLEELIDRYMNKKSGGSYQASDMVMSAIFADSPELGASLVQGFYSVSDETTPQAFQLEFYHRMQGVLARKDEEYYFRGSDTEAGNRKTKDLFNEFMKRLGVTDIKNLTKVPFAVGATRSLTPFEVIRRTALKENAMGKSPYPLIEEARLFTQAQARVLEAPRSSVHNGFDTGVLGEYGVILEPHFELVRSGSTTSLGSTVVDEADLDPDSSDLGTTGGEPPIDSGTDRRSRALGEVVHAEAGIVPGSRALPPSHRESVHYVDVAAAVGETVEEVVTPVLGMVAATSTQHPSTSLNAERVVEVSSSTEDGDDVKAPRPTVAKRGGPQAPPFDDAGAGTVTGKITPTTGVSPERAGLMAALNTDNPMARLKPRTTTTGGTSDSGVPGESLPPERAGLMAALNTDNPMARLKPRTTTTGGTSDSGVPGESLPPERDGLLAALKADNPMARLKKASDRPAPKPKTASGGADFFKAALQAKFKSVRPPASESDSEWSDEE